MVYKNFKESQQIHLRTILLPVIFFSFMAGHINSLFLFLNNHTISHLTGNVSHLGQFFLHHPTTYVFTPLAIITSFILGSILSGYVLIDQKYESTKKYGLLTVIEGILLLLAAYLYPTHEHSSLLLCSLGMGLQNGMISSYKGLIIRTTHMTGIVTDFGFAIGSSLKSKSFNYQKILFLFAILISFVFGAGSGYFCAEEYQFLSLYFFSIVCIIIGSLYFKNRIQNDQNLRSIN